MASKVFIVTGASKGIGAAVVQQLLSQSHNVVITARSEALLQSLKNSHPKQVEYVTGDITESATATKLVDVAVKTWGKLDGLVINHSVLEVKKLSDTSLEELKRVFDVNVFSGINLANAGLAELRKTKGAIVWVSSGAASKAYVAWGTYGSSKAALNSLSSHYAVEEPDVVSIALAPGRVDTDMQAVIRDKGEGTMNKIQFDSFVSAFQEGTLLKPEQPGSVIAGVVAKPAKELSGKFLRYVPKSITRSSCN